MSKGNGRIWVVNFAGHNLAAALEFTELPPDDAFVFLSEGNVNIFETDRIRWEFDRALKDFDHDKDMLLLTGATILNMLAVLALAETGKEVSVLVWHAKAREYIKRRIRL